MPELAAVLFGASTAVVWLLVDAPPSTDVVRLVAAVISFGTAWYLWRWSGRA